MLLILSTVCDRIHHTMRPRCLSRDTCVSATSSWRFYLVLFWSPTYASDALVMLESYKSSHLRGECSTQIGQCSHNLQICRQIDLLFNESGSSMPDIPDGSIALLQGFMISGLVDVAIASWCCYEWVITIDQEVNHIWLQKWTLSTWIFAGARYTALLQNLLQISPGASQIVSDMLTIDYQIPIISLLIHIAFLAQRYASYFPTPKSLE
ncbi:hypothetical protein BC629DRAFT_353577 [Irpex lacteus]|nr:hypothetical protein BC629DRAFT_353577 [Irpex lacteus]